MGVRGLRGRSLERGGLEMVWCGVVWCGVVWFLNYAGVSGRGEEESLGWRGLAGAVAAFTGHARRRLEDKER